VVSLVEKRCTWKCCINKCRCMVW